MTKIYPIDCQLKTETAAKPAKILSISHNGLVIDSLDLPLLVNKTYTVSFIFPLIDEPGEVTAVVFRTYAEVKAKKTQGRVHMNELIFKTTSTKFKKLVIKFLARVSNKKI